MSHAGANRSHRERDMGTQSRIERITRASDEINRCVRERGKHASTGDRLGVTLGECDWLEELHRLLFQWEEYQTWANPTTARE